MHKEIQKLNTLTSKINAPTNSNTPIKQLGHYSTNMVRIKKINTKKSPKLPSNITHTKTATNKQRYSLENTYMNKKKSIRIPPQNPHTQACERRKTINITQHILGTNKPKLSKNIKKLDQRLSKDKHSKKYNIICISNQTQKHQNIITNNKLTSNVVISYSSQMTGRGTSRDLTADPDFIMRDANSPPQGTKMSGSKAISAENKNKTTPKEAFTTTQQFWLGFEMLEKLAIKEGAPWPPIPTSTHNLIRAGFFGEKNKKNSQIGTLIPSCSSN